MRQFVVGLTAMLAGCAAANQCLLTPRTPRADESQLSVNSCQVPRHWEHFPVSLQAELSPEYEHEAHEAVRIWNGLVGFEFLTWGSGTASILITEEDLGDNLHEIRKLGQATTWVGTDNSIESALIQLDTNLSSTLLVPVILHEIGHALGLAHDERDPRSLMFPMTWEPRIQRLTAEDVNAIRVQLPEGLPRAPIVRLSPSPLASFSGCPSRPLIID